MGAQCDCTLHNHNHNGWVQQGIVTIEPVSLCLPSMSLVAGWWNRRHEGFGNFVGREHYNCDGSNSRSISKKFHGNDEMKMIQEL